MQPSTNALSYQMLVQEFKASPPGKLYCLHGTKAVFRLSLYAASHALLNGVPIALVDGTNRFDAYYIAEFARRVTAQRIVPHNVPPEQLLKNIFVSRAFTCYQMEAAITERLPAFLKRSHASVAIIFGLLDTFYDDQAPLFEVQASLQRVLLSLRKRKEEHVSVLLASHDTRLESTERNALFPTLTQAMDRVFTVKEDNDGRHVIVQPEIPGTSQFIRKCTANSPRKEYAHGKNRSYIHHGYPAGNGKLDKISTRSPQGRSGRI